MDRPMPNLAFNGMALLFQIRDALSPRDGILDELEIRRGDRVLDYGCGPGSYVPLLANRVGAEGRVYALDIHPLAVARVQALAGRKGLRNVETICADGRTELPGNSVDLVLLFDLLHMLSQPDAVLAELHRVLKPGGTLAVLDPHMQDEDLLHAVTGGGFFRLDHRGEKTHSFVPA